MSAENPSSPTPERPRPPSQSRRQETDPSRATPAASPRRLRASTATPRAPNMPQPGDLIDERYLIESVIGKGGMGCVLSARHMLLQTQVAIKLLKAQTPLASEMLERFLREGRAIAALRGEYVVRVMDMGMIGDGVLYFVMEFLFG